MVNKIQNIAIIGSGTMGCQIALQCALFGYKVKLFARNDVSRNKAKEMLIVYLGRMRMDKIINQERIPAILKVLSINQDLKETICDADIIIETIIENKQAKENLYKELSTLCLNDTIIVTNTSTFLPSMFTEFISHKERFLALHFHSYVWKTTIVDIMGHQETSEEIKSKVIDFAISIGQTPMVMKKERRSYVFNAMIFEVMWTALQLLSEDVAEVKEIDMIWKRILGTKVGLFQMMDTIGLDVISEILDSYKKDLGARDIDKISAIIYKYKEKGRLGIKTGEGFYKY